MSLELEKIKRVAGKLEDFIFIMNDLVKKEHIDELDDLVGELDLIAKIMEDAK